jgi:cysteine-rich repeat protein
MWYNNVISMKQILNQKSGAVLSVLMAVVMVAGALQHARLTHAADEPVCGDGVWEGVEECDDGDLVSGDGCSSTCLKEVCGNNRVDFAEQCDDGNAVANDGCSNYCLVEFCGDRSTQDGRGEECDDGNNLSGDGCSSSCKLEGNTLIREDVLPEPEPLPAQPVVLTQADAALAFLDTPAGEEIMTYLSREEGIQLETILKKLDAGKRLTAQERAWAIALYQKLQETKLAERVRYTDLLKEFIATPISSEVVDEKNLQKSRLVDVEVPIAIEELRRAVAIIRRGELQKQVVADVSKLTRQGLDISADTPTDYASYLTPGNRPIQVFATLKSIKEAAEKYATGNVPGSLEIIRSEAQILRQALPIFELEYELNPQDVDPLLVAIEDVTLKATRQSVYGVVEAINEFLAVLAEKKIFTTSDLALLAEADLHAAANAERIAVQLDKSDELRDADSLASFVQSLAILAPEDLRDIFSYGRVDAQRQALREMLLADKRITDLRQILRDAGDVEYDQRFTALMSEIGNTGNGMETFTVCDDSMTDALQCANQYLVDLQEAVRGRSITTRVVGFFQDLFGIGI